MHRIVHLINSLNDWIGKTISWLTLAMVCVTFLVVVLRYAFSFGSVAMQESISYMHALVFMLGISYTLRHDAHVRVDIFYQRCSRKTRALIDILGVLFLLWPVTIFIIWSSWGYIVDSWTIKESSSNSGGLPGIYLIKSTIIVSAALILLQGLSLLLSNIILAFGENTPLESDHG